MPWTVASVHGNLQARKMEWVAIPFSRGSSQIRDEPMSPTLQADSLPSEPSITSILPTLLETWVSSIYMFNGFPDGSSGKESPCNAGDTGNVGLMPGSGRSPGEENSEPLQYACKIPWTEKPSGLQSIGSQRVGHD